MVDAYILKIDKVLAKEEFARLLNCVSGEKRERILRFHRSEDAQRTLLGDILSRYALCKRFNLQNKDLVFGVNEYGKPLLPGFQDVHFNISHSGPWVACAVDDKPVGIDVEIIKPMDFKIAERFFSKDEYHSLMTQPEAMKLNYFYRLWTLKESYIKAEGKGLSIPLDSFSISIGRDSITAVADGETREYRFFQSFLEDTSVYAICTSDRDPIEKNFLNVEGFLESYV